MGGVFRALSKRMLCEYDDYIIAYLASGGQVPTDCQNCPPDGSSNAEVVQQYGDHDAPDITQVAMHEIRRCTITGNKSAASEDANQVGSGMKSAVV